ncbi:MAG: lipocalin-like domain-containing protein, partial [Burkholderiaceae bacterium]
MRLSSTQRRLLIKRTLGASALGAAAPSRQTFAETIAAIRIGTANQREAQQSGFKTIQFPRDHGAHPDERIEWWYLTGWLDADTGIQATIFRVRLGKARQSTWGSNQWLMGHAALVRRGWSKLIHEQTAWRSVKHVAEFSETDLNIMMPGWRFVREADGRIAIDIEQGRLGLKLRCRPRGAPLLQGQQGYSQKGPAAGQFSHYYSQTQLHVEANLHLDGKALSIDRSSNFAAAWFDHEWSSSLLSADAAGWDWFGLNLLDGQSWMAFRIRDRQGAELWRSEAGLVMQTLEQWRSSASGANYPVSLRVKGKFGPLVLKALVQDQEIDARASTGNRYWEGAVMAYNDQGDLIGRGYLELTGYDRPMRL